MNCNQQVDGKSNNFKTVLVFFALRIYRTDCIEKRGKNIEAAKEGERGGNQVLIYIPVMSDTCYTLINQSSVLYTLLSFYNFIICTDDIYL